MDKYQARPNNMINANVNWMSSQATFPVRLHAMLAEVEQDPVLSRLVAWRPHGRLFVVEDRNGFMKHILPNWFTMNSYASFQRQCNMYGFKRMTSGPDKGGYYHELFVRGNPDMAARIPRLKYKGTGPRKPACPEQEPDFYKMPAPVSFDRAPPGWSSCSNAFGGGSSLSLGALLVNGACTDPPARPLPLLATSVPQQPPQPCVASVANPPPPDQFKPSSALFVQRPHHPPQCQHQHQKDCMNASTKSFDDLVDALDYSIAAVDDALEVWELLDMEPLPLFV